jgi:hypothetical protein
MIKIAKALLSNKEVKIYKTDGIELPFENNSFEIVFTSTVLQHNTNEANLKLLIKDICRVSNGDIYLFERIEKTIKGHETNLGRPISYYESIFKDYGFSLKAVNSININISYFVCGVLRKIFNSNHKEGEPLSRITIIMQTCLLPITSLLDKIFVSKRDLHMLFLNNKV